MSQGHFKTLSSPSLSWFAKTHWWLNRTAAWQTTLCLFTLLVYCLDFLCKRITVMLKLFFSRSRLQRWKGEKSWERGLLTSRIYIFFASLGQQCRRWQRTCHQKDQVEINIHYNKQNGKFILEQRSTGHQSEKNRKDKQVPAKTDKHRTPVWGKLKRRQQNECV